MKRFRIGNDIEVRWSVRKNGENAVLSDKTIKLYMTHSRGKEEITSFSVEGGNKVKFVLEGLKQNVLGKYTLTIDVRNNSGSRYLIADKCGAFELVGRSCVEEPEETDYIIEL